VRARCALDGPDVAGGPHRVNGRNCAWTGLRVRDSSSAVPGERFSGGPSRFTARGRCCSVHGLGSPTRRSVRCAHAVAFGLTPSAPLAGARELGSRSAPFASPGSGREAEAASELGRRRATLGSCERGLSSGTPPSAERASAGLPLQDRGILTVFQPRRATARPPPHRVGLIATRPRCAAETYFPEQLAVESRAPASSSSRLEHS
jgi:hypothetical protein